MTLRTSLLVLSASLSLLTTGCAARGLPASVAPVPLPPQPVVATALPLGEESIYALLNEGSLAKADKLLRDVWVIPRFPDTHLSVPLNWREDPFHQSYWRFLFYSLRPTSNLLWAYETTHDTRYRDKLLSILTSYVTYDETYLPLTHLSAVRKGDRRLDFPYGAAFRAMVITNTYYKLQRSHDLPADLASRLRASIARLGTFLLIPGNNEGAYNHGFIEASALFILSENFPTMPDAAALRAVGLSRLDALMQKTVDSDGVEVENSPFYHFYVLDFALQMRLWAKENNVTLSAVFNHQLQSMFDYASYIVEPNTALPLLGASVQSFVEASRSIYKDAEQADPEFLFAVSGGQAGSAPAERAKIFPSSGEAVLRSNAHDGPYVDNTQVTMNVGPVRTIHSHIDALALTYYSHGRVLLTDSGLFTYTAGPNYVFFHGTSAHNTVVVDGKDQPLGPVTVGKNLTGSGWAYQSGEHTLYPGVRHARSVIVLRRDLMIVLDQLTSNQPHRYQQLWHLVPYLHLISEGATTTAFDGSDHPVLAVTEDAPQARFSDTLGQALPMQGWVSSLYGSKAPDHVLGFTNTSRNATFATAVTSGGLTQQPVALTTTHAGSLSTVNVCVGPMHFVVMIRNAVQSGESVTVTTPPGGCVR
jgi:hypothetical protein